MPSSTDRQKRFFGAVMGAKKGLKNVSGKAKEVAHNMSESKIKDYLKVAYAQGFIDKCAARNVDPEYMAKVAQQLGPWQNYGEGQVRMPINAPAPAAKAPMAAPRMATNVMGQASMPAAFNATGTVAQAKAPAIKAPPIKPPIKPPMTNAVPVGIQQPVANNSAWAQQSRANQNPEVARRQAGAAQVEGRQI